jgi:hypothetical protein
MKRAMNNIFSHKRVIIYGEFPPMDRVNYLANKNQIINR